MLAKITAALVAFGPLGALVIAFIDSAGVPLAMGADALVVLVGVRAPDRVWLTAALALAGSMGGNWLLYELARKGGRRWAGRKAAAPPPGGKRRFREWFDRYGLVTVFIPAVIPIPLPLKVFVVFAGVLRTPLAHFLLVMLAARLIRYFGLAWLAVQLGEGAHDFVRQNTWNLTLAAVVLTAALFLLIRLSDRRRASAVRS